MEMRYTALCFAALLTVGAALAQTPDIAPAPGRRVSGGSQGAAPRAALTLECNLYWRHSVTVGNEKQAKLELSRDQEQKSATLGDITVKAFYSNNPYDAASLVVDVVRVDTGDTILHHLYQMQRGTKPVNQFVGDHGMSGLLYIYHPASHSELQMIVKAR
jgi:hypothetical protein